MSESITLKGGVGNGKKFSGELQDHQHHIVYKYAVPFPSGPVPCFGLYDADGNFLRSYELENPKASDETVELPFALLEETPP